MPPTRAGQTGDGRRRKRNDEREQDDSPTHWRQLVSRQYVEHHQTGEQRKREDGKSSSEAQHTR